MTKTELEQAVNARIGQIESALAPLTDAEAVRLVTLYPKWEPDTRYPAGYVFQFDGNLYRVVQDHTSQSDWTPDITPALYTRIADPAEEWPEWVQPTGAQDAYMMGAKCSHSGNHWISDIDNNVWAPGVFGWREA